MFTCQKNIHIAAARIRSRVARIGINLEEWGTPIILGLSSTQLSRSGAATDSKINLFFQTSKRYFSEGMLGKKTCWEGPPRIARRAVFLMQCCNRRVVRLRYRVQRVAATAAPSRWRLPTELARARVFCACVCVTSTSHFLLTFVAVVKNGARLDEGDAMSINTTRCDVACSVAWNELSVEWYQTLPGPSSSVMFVHVSTLRYPYHYNKI